MIEWDEWLDQAPERVAEVIESGPIPLVEYGWGNVEWRDKSLGISRYKGGQSRGGVGLSAKSGHAAVVYFDPAFITAEEPLSIPDDVLNRHAQGNVENAFREM